MQLLAASSGFDTGQINGQQQLCRLVSRLDSTPKLVVYAVHLTIPNLASCHSPGGHSHPSAARLWLSRLPSQTPTRVRVRDRATLTLTPTPRIAMFGVLRGEGAVLLSYKLYVYL